MPCPLLVVSGLLSLKFYIHLSLGVVSEGVISMSCLASLREVLEIVHLYIFCGKRSLPLLDNIFLHDQIGKVLWQHSVLSISQPGCSHVVEF